MVSCQWVTEVSNTLFFGPLDGSSALGKVIIARAVMVIEPGVVARDIR